jgi:hypothetical protein
MIFCIDRKSHENEVLTHVFEKDNDLIYPIYFSLIIQL